LLERFAFDGERLKSAVELEIRFVNQPVVGSV
jgi:hypothetical protein